MDLFVCMCIMCMQPALTEARRGVTGGHHVGAGKKHRSLARADSALNF